MLIGATDTATVVPIGIGVVLGGIGAVGAIRAAGPSPEPQRRFVARLVTAGYTGIALLCLVGAIALDDAAFIAFTALILVVAIAAAATSFRR